MQFFRFLIQKILILKTANTSLMGLKKNRVHGEKPGRKGAVRIAEEKMTKGDRALLEY